MGRNKKTELDDRKPVSDFDTFQELCMIYRTGSIHLMSVKGVPYEYVNGKGWVKANEVVGNKTDNPAESIFTDE